MSERLTEVHLVDDRGRTVCVFVYSSHGSKPAPAGALQRRQREAGGDKSLSLPVEKAPPPPLLALIPYPDQRAMGPSADPTRGPHWMAQRRPVSHARRQRIEEQAEASDLGVAVIPSHVPREAFPVTFDDDGRPVRLELPGLPSLRWDKVVMRLDALADEFIGPRKTMTTVEFLRLFR